LNELDTTIIAKQRPAVSESETGCVTMEPVLKPCLISESASWWKFDRSTLNEGLNACQLVAYVMSCSVSCMGRVQETISHEVVSAAGAIQVCYAKDLESDFSAELTHFAKFVNTSSAYIHCESKNLTIFHLSITLANTVRFLPRDAMQARPLPSCGVCLCVSVCLSRSYILSKPVNISSKFSHRRVAAPL